MADFKAALQHNPQVQISYNCALCNVIVLNNVMEVSIFSVEYTLLSSLLLDLQRNLNSVQAEFVGHI